jgi:WD40 repeat protein
MLPTAAWDHTKQLLAAAGRDGALWVWDARNQTIAAHRFLDDRVRQYVESAPEGSSSLVPQSALKDAVRPRVAFSPDGTCLAAIDTYGQLKLWSADRWQPLTTFPGKHAEVHCLAFSPDGAMLFTNNRGQAQLYEVATGRLIGTLRSETNSNIMCAGFSPDGKWLAFGTLNGKVHCFDSASRELQRSLVGHLDAVSALAISPDGQMIATGGWDTTVRLWNVASGREVAVLEGHRGRIHALAFSPDGGTLASGGEMEGGMGEVRLWFGNRDQTARTVP